MVWAIFPILYINWKFQWTITSIFSITISFINGPFFMLNGTMAHGMAHGPTPSQPLE